MPGLALEKDNKLEPKPPDYGQDLHVASSISAGSAQHDRERGLSPCARTLVHSV